MKMQDHVFAKVFEQTSDNVQSVNFDVERDTNCVICKKKFTRRQLVQDHCHQTGLQRGRICSKCNVMIGMAGDNPMILRNAIDYLAEWFLTHAKVIEERKARNSKS